jgi:hypothetical protein
VLDRLDKTANAVEELEASSSWGQSRHKTPNITVLALEHDKYRWESV